MEGHRKAFWERMDWLVTKHEVQLDRPRGTPHPRYPTKTYPRDYGYLEGTQSGDGEGIDVWIGSGDPDRVTAVICTYDSEKQDAELKLLLGCTEEDCVLIEAFHNQGQQAGLLILRKEAEGNIG